MSNETNEGIIIKGGVSELHFNNFGMFPITIPVEEIKIQGGVSNKSQGYYIPTMKGFWIMVGNSGDVRHSPRIKVSSRNVNFKDHDKYNSYSYDNGEIQVIRGRNAGIKKKDEKEIEEFLLRNFEDVILNSNSTKQDKRIDDQELYSRILKRESEFYRKENNI